MLNQAIVLKLRCLKERLQHVLQNSHPVIRLYKQECKHSTLHQTTSCMLSNTASCLGSDLIVETHCRDSFARLIVIPIITFVCVNVHAMYSSKCSKTRKEGNVLFNDALNTFYLRLYGVRYMVKDHSDSERGNQLPPHRLLFPISSKGSFICIIPQTE